MRPATTYDPQSLGKRVGTGDAGCDSKEVLVTRTRLQWVCIFALLVFPLSGCSDPAPDGGGGAGGGAGTGGTGGQAGAGAIGGGGGTGGAEPITAGLWMGSGDQGPGAPWTICFGVNQNGTALTAIEGCQDFAIQVAFDGCPNSVWWRPDIPIAEGSFRLLDETTGVDITGTFAGDSASGQGSFTTPQGTCTNEWTAAPIP